MASSQLTPTQLTDLSELLRQRERALSLVVERELHADGAAEISVTTATDADWVISSVDADASIAKAERDSSELTEVANALDRVHTGRYGVCEACGRDIGYTRLLVHPAARRCLDCQQAVEDQGRSPIASSKRQR